MNTEKMLSQMKANKRNWSMKDLKLVASQLDIQCSNNGSSHYVFGYTGIHKNLSIPNHKDIHPDYITQFIRFIENVMQIQKNT